MIDEDRKIYEDEDELTVEISFEDFKEWNYIIGDGCVAVSIPSEQMVKIAKMIIKEDEKIRSVLFEGEK